MMNSLYLLNGALGGLAATIFASLFIYFFMDKELPPTAEIFEKYGSVEDKDYVKESIASFYLYGAVLGILFAMLYPYLRAMVASSPVPTRYLIMGMFLAAIGLSYALREHTPDIEIRWDRARSFLALHLLYASILGLWLGLGITIF